MKSIAYLTVTLAVLPFTPTALALVNPSLQPIHLYERYKVVLAGKVSRGRPANEDAAVESGRITLEVSAVCKGEFADKEIVIDVPAKNGRDKPEHEASKDWNIWDIAQKDRTFVAFVGKTRQRGEQEILLYCGDRQWHHARIADLTKPAAWTYQAASEDVMVGTFNGDSDRLAEMLADTKDGTAFFPADVNVRLNRDVASASCPAASAAWPCLISMATASLTSSPVRRAGSASICRAIPSRLPTPRRDLGLSGVCGMCCAPGRCQRRRTKRPAGRHATFSQDGKRLRQGTAAGSPEGVSLSRSRRSCNSTVTATRTFSCLMWMGD